MPPLQCRPTAHRNSSIRTVVHSITTCKQETTSSRRHYQFNLLTISIPRLLQSTSLEWNNLTPLSTSHLALFLSLIKSIFAVTPVTLVLLNCHMMMFITYWHFKYSMAYQLFVFFVCFCL